MNFYSIPGTFLLKLNLTIQENLHLGKITCNTIYITIDDAKHNYIRSFVWGVSLFTWDYITTGWLRGQHKSVKIIIMESTWHSSNLNFVSSAREGGH